jgi:polyisoprenoid-binding protein YceI
LISKFTGSLTKVSGSVTVDRDQLEQNSVAADIEIASINTANEKRDAHVKSPDFFGLAKYTAAFFKSTAWKKTGDNTFNITGDLKVKDATKPVVLKANLPAFGAGRDGAKLSGWEATTTIKKSDFGLAGPAMLAKALGDEVTINIGIEAGMKK